MSSVKEILKETEDNMKKAIESVKREFNEVQTGRAHTGLIEGVHVDYYGTSTMIKDMASISVPDPRTITIQPWDATALAEIEKALLASNVGITPNNDGKAIRLNIPALSEERREELKKVVKDMAEKAKVSVRTVRREANEKLKKLEADKVIAKDDNFKAQESVQKITDTYTHAVDKALEEKSKSLMEI